MTMSVPMSSRPRICVAGVLAAVIFIAGGSSPGSAHQAPPPVDHSQHVMPTKDHSQHQMVMPPAANAKKKKTQAKAKPAADHFMHPPSHREAAPTVNHTDHGITDGSKSMRGFLGPYDITREASGTSWQPDTT